MNDLELLALCSYEESRNQPDDGVAAVVHVVLDRVRLGYQCDHSIAGAITRHAQFSWVEYEMGQGGYHQVAFGTAAELARIQQLLAIAKTDQAQWARCSRIAGDVMAGKYRGGAAYGRLTSDTVLYFNPDACAAPPWARVGAFVCRIGAHSFYRDLAVSAGLRQASAPTRPAPPSGSAAVSETVLHNL